MATTLCLSLGQTTRNSTHVGPPLRTAGPPAATKEDGSRPITTVSVRAPLTLFGSSVFRVASRNERRERTYTTHCAPLTNSFQLPVGQRVVQSFHHPPQLGLGARSCSEQKKGRCTCVAEGGVSDHNERRNTET